jgi:hypothetical protein
MDSVTTLSELIEDCLKKTPFGINLQIEKTKSFASLNAPEEVEGVSAEGYTPEEAVENLLKKIN